MTWFILAALVYLVGFVVAFVLTVGEDFGWKDAALFALWWPIVAAVLIVLFVDETIRQVCSKRRKENNR